MDASPSRRQQQQPPVRAPRKETTASVAGHAIFELSVDRTFEFDGGSGFGATLPSNRPLPATPAPHALASPLLQPPLAGVVGGASASAPHKFTFTSSSEYTSPKKIPVFPGTQGSPETKKMSAKRSGPTRSPRAKQQHGQSSAVGISGGSPPYSVAVGSFADKPRRESSPRKFLRDSLAHLPPGLHDDDTDGDADEHGLSPSPSPVALRSPSRVGAQTLSANQTRSPSVFVVHHDPATQTSSVASADAAAEAAAASAVGFLRTGEDAIAFFARNGSDSEIKFVHLNRAGAGVAFRPYDLVVVSQGDVASEHFTMSSSGLVHMSPGSPSEFVALAEWMRQSTLFNVLTSLRFFKHYLMSKALALWRANVRFKLYCRQRRKLEATLFLAKESFCAPLLQVKKVMSADVLSVVLLDLRAQKTYESAAFVEYQATKRTEAAKQFEACIERLQAIIQKVCADVKSLARGAASSSSSDPHDDALADAAALGGSGAHEKTKSIVAVKSEQQQRRKLLLRARAEAAMISDLIRLVDYVAVESFVVLAVQSCREFLHELNKMPRKTGLFETTIFFGDDATVFAPTSEQIQHIVVSMTDDIVGTVNAVSRVLYLRPFAPYVASAVADAPHVGATISASADFQQIRRELAAKIGADYSEAAEYVRIFDTVRPIFEYDKRWDLDAYAQRAHTVATLKADMLQMSTWEKELEKMRAGQTIGILHVESRKLKQALIPMTAAKLDAMKGLVKDLARAKCKSQLGEYKQRIQALLQRPQHLKEFAAHVERVQVLKLKHKALAKNTNVVDELYRLLGHYGVRITSEDMVQLDDLRSVQESYRDETDAVDAFVQARVGDMAQQLEANIQRLDEQVLQLHGQLQTGLFVDPEQFEDPALVKSELEAAKQRLAQLDELAKQYSEYQVLFSQPPFQYANLTATQEFFATVEALWAAVETWNSTYRTALTSAFVDVNAEELAKDVAAAFKDAYALHKKLSNDVTAALKDRTADFKLKMPTVLELGNPAMKDRHWEKIFKALRQPWYPGIVFTLENLVAYEVLEMKDLIGDVSSTASGEAQIEASLAKIKRGWDEMAFTCLSHREQKDAFILGSLEDVLTLLEDNQVTLQTMMGSRFILGVKDEVDRWNRRLALLADTLDEWTACQRSWMYLETIFGAEDIQKQLPAEAQKFALVDKSWRTVMLRTSADPSVIRSVEAGAELLEQFRVANAVLEAIQKSLEDYLETKRMGFPRFYFLSNDELLEILSQTRDPRAVQPHLCKCFDAMKSLRFDAATPAGGGASNVVSAMVSGEGEVVAFPSRVTAAGPVEAWLVEVEKAMRASLYEDGVKALLQYPVEDAIDRRAWLFGYAAQVVILVDQVFWTRNVTEALSQVERSLDAGAVESFLQFSLKQIDGMVQLVRGALSKLERILLGAVITIDVHARDVVRALRDGGVASLSDFEWTRQLRYYWEDDVKNFRALERQLALLELQSVPSFIAKAIQVHETQLVRHGMMLVGEAGSGKSTNCFVLARALTQLCEDGVVDRDGFFKELSAMLLALIETHVPIAIAFVRDHCREKIASNNASLMTGCLNLLAACLSTTSASGGVGGADLTARLRMYFVFSVTWSVGANVDDASRPKFNDFCMGQLATLLAGDSAGSASAVDNVYDVVVDDATGQWASWVDHTPRFAFQPGASYFSMVVPTPDTTRFRYLLEKLLLAGRHVLYSGETGVGKSVIVQSFLDDMARTERGLAATMSYSAQTTPRNLVEQLELKLEKKRKNLLGPPAGKRMLFFVDDLNMPALEVYGAQPPNELLRQVVDQGGFYDTAKLFFKHVRDVVVAAACAPPGGGRSDVSPRLLRHFHMVWLPGLSGAIMKRIFTAILGGFLAAELPLLAQLAGPVVAASVQLYQRVELELLPTPSKSHYTFNLRDLSKVFQGVLMVRKESVASEEALLRLWLHEEARVFRDRLVDTADRGWFNAACAELLEAHAGVAWPPVAFEHLLYGDYLTRENRAYRAVEDPARLHALLLEYLDEYNVSSPSPMHLVFFSDAVHHISRICRVLRQPRGNALLVGVGGSGRQSLTRLAAFMAGYQCFAIEITRGYGAPEFHEDLKRVLLAAGAENRPVVFLFSDAQIVHESFLEDINNVLNTGDVPNLYAADELEKIVAAVRPLALQAGKVTREDVLQHYVTLVRENLHVVLAVSPIGASFRNRCRMFPSLVNCCTIDWFNAWPEDALASVAQRFFAGSAAELGIERHVDTLGAMAVAIHRSVEEATAAFAAQLQRRNYTTPTSYLELIKLYVDMLRSRRHLVRAKEARYRGGLQKLAETEEVVGNLQRALTDLQPVLATAQAATATLLVQVAKDQAAADAQQQFIQSDVAAANAIAEEVKAIKDECQADLDEAMPAYFASIKALAQLKKDDVTVMKTFTNPPRLVGVTMNAVCLLFGAKQEWNEAKKLLNDMKFLDKLKDFDKDNIPPKTIRALQKFMADDEFTPENLSSISTAATSLCMWVRAMYTYDTVAKNIAPKKESLRLAEERLAREQQLLAAKQAGLRDVLRQVADLKRTLEGAQQTKRDLEQQTATTQAQLARAERLIDSLGEEQGRWKECAEGLALDRVNLVGDMILAAGCIAYLGPFTAEFRHALQAKWAARCAASGLPVDAGFSFQRAAAAGTGAPALQLLKLAQKDLLRTLENAIRYGAPVLLENVEEELDPALEPVLLKQVFRRGGQLVLHLGDSDVPYSDSFRLFITTKLANPHYMPEVCIKVTVINFTVTRSGLEDQLLVDVVRSERPDLETKKSELTVAIAADTKQLKEIEDKILFMLENSQGNILDDEELIDTLAHSKVTSSAIKTRMAEAETTSREIDRTREGYRGVAVRGSIIYFATASLALVDPMYQYSLQFYQKLFVLRLAAALKADALDARLEILVADITTSMFVNVCRGLFEKDKIVYAFVVAASILLQRGAVTAAEWGFYLVGDKRSPAAQSALAAAVEADGGAARPAWLSERVWKALLGLREVSPAFERLAESIAAAPDGWKRAMVLSDLPHTEPLPTPWEATLSSFQRLLVLRVFREEMLVFGTREFVGRELGRFFTESPPFDLQGCYRDSTPETPLIFVLSPGADINDYLLELAKQEGKDGPGLKIISLGQGQGPIAEALMKQCKETGDWVCLQNCHLAVSWLGRLEQILELAQSEQVHPDFRLWLTSMPSARFPVPILQNGIKITNEPPKGIRANLGRTFLDMKEADYEGCAKPREFKKLVFALAFYNAVCLERRKFGAVGWNIPYEWMNSDLKTGMQQVRLYLEEQDAVPYVTLNVMVADVSYGGRITDRWDKRTNSSIMRKLFCKEVMDDAYRFTSSETYLAPPEGSLAAVREYVGSLPTADAPDIFGLHANADITFQQKETGQLLGTILRMLGGDGGGSGGDSGGGAAAQSSDSVVMEMVVSIQERMPDFFSEARGHASTFQTAAGGSRNSLGVFLSQEMIRFNALIRVMKQTLEMLKRAIKGLVVMSGPLEKMYSGFLVQQVPKEWENAGYPCLKPLASWIEDFFARIAFTSEWLVGGPPLAFWLSGFFFPQGFMTAVKQSFSRERQIAIDALVVSCEAMAKDKDAYLVAPPFGVYIYGLFMEGARYDRKAMMIAESIPNELFDRMPVIWLKPMRREEYKPADVYECPLYKTSIRAGTLSTTGHSTNFVVSLDIPTDKDPDHWIRRGCAMLCMLDT
ncbi:hypothetical protein PybrP1_003505 [[Pythium] brassicae (nom. inval.)]|nr:hypothetical protein PybrP1_003505 [[Pythium] brassicae (nom. inval.)]